MEFKNLSLLELRDLITSGQTTSKVIYDYFLERSAKYNPELGVYNTLPSETNPQNHGNTETDIGLGLPIAVKDLFCEK